MQYQHSPFRFAGGKFYARDLILEHVPKHTCYCEPLCGGASIFFAKPKVKRNILNDIDEELINCFLTIRDKPQELIEFLKEYPATKECHAFFKNTFSPSDNFERAVRWFYLNRTSYSGIMKMENCYWGYGDKYSMRPENWGRNILKTSEKLQGIEILNEDFEILIKKLPKNTFLFIDPPYFNRDQDKFYSHSFTKEDHTRLMKILKKNSKKLKFLITYDNTPEIHEIYSWATSILEREWHYTIYRTDDQTKNGDGADKKHNGKRYKGKEIFILNYEPTANTLDRFI
jgi:DNA adenine methylase